MIRTMIVDDEAKSRASLRSLLRKYCPQVQIVAEAEDIEGGLKELASAKPELLFLDVNLKEGTGFDLLDSLERVQVEVVFITAHDNFAVKAFRYSAMDYLLKPVDPDDLQAAVAKIQNKAQNLEQNALKINTLVQQYRSSNPFQKLALPTLSGMELIDLGDLIRCESDNNYTWFYLRQDEKILVSRSLSEYEDLLSGDNFLRIHQSHLVNLNYLKKYIKGDGGQVVLADGTVLNVSRRNKARLLQRLGMG